jgi:hypothetical protein
MNSIIFIRSKNGATKFLNWRYRWSNMPDVFPACQLPVIREVMLHPRNPAQPTGWARVETVWLAATQDRKDNRR